MLQRILPAGFIATARPSSPMPASSASKALVSKQQGFRLPFRRLARLAQNEELRCTGREARSGGRREEEAVTKLEFISPPARIFHAMSAYLTKSLTRPLPTKDG